jgi:hypothetical protein
LALQQLSHLRLETINKHDDEEVIAVKTSHHFTRWFNLVLLLVLVLSAVPVGTPAWAQVAPGLGQETVTSLSLMPLPVLIKRTLKAAPLAGTRAALNETLALAPASSATANSCAAAPTSVLAAPHPRPLAMHYGASQWASSHVPAEGYFVVRGNAIFAGSTNETWNLYCLHDANLTFAWNGGDFSSVRWLGRGFGPPKYGCVTQRGFEHWFNDTDAHGQYEHYRVLDHLDISYFATAADFGIGVENVWEVLPDDPPSSFAGKWDVENPIPSRASTLITYTHDLQGWPTHELTQTLNLAYNGCFDSANGWGEWSYSFPSGSANASFWAPRIGHERPGAWVLHGYAQVFQWLEGLEPDTEYGLSFYVYHPFKTGDKRSFKVIGRLIDGQPDLSYVYKLSLAQDDAWEHVSVRARTDAQGRLYAAVQAGNGNAAWLAIDDLMVWAEPDQGIAPLEGDCGTSSCDLLHHGPVDVQVSDLHLGLSPEGWPSPNPIAITATWDLEGELPSGWEGYVRLKVENLLEDRTRVYLVPEDGESKSRFELGTEYNLDGSLLDPAAWYQIGEEFDGYYYYHPSSGALYTYKKVRSSDLYGTAHWKIWVQPSDEAKLSLTVEVFHKDEAGRPQQEPVTDPPNLWDRTCVQVPQADVHPVVFVHGILGSMPPKNDIFYDWPHEEGNVMFSGGTLLEPWLDSYTPMMDNWVKMGYEPGQSMFIVTYNWMQSNRVSAAWLYDKLLEINGLGTPAYVDNSQVDLVVHSMGGLVSRAYLEGLANPDPTTGGGYPYANNVDKVVFIASPHRGFPITYRT